MALDIVSHMTQTANPVTLLVSLLGEEGHEVAKGCRRVRMIMILLFYVLSPFARGAADWRSGPRRSILSALCLVHPFASSRHFPSRGNEGSEEKNSESYTSRTISAFSPFGGERSEPITRMLNMLYDIESQSRNADFISIARRAIHNPRGRRPRQT